MTRRPFSIFAPNYGSAIDHLTAFCTDDALMDAVLSRVDAFLYPGFTTPNVTSDYTDANVRLAAALRRNGTRFILDIGGPIGYNPSYGPAAGGGPDSGLTGRSTPAEQGLYSAMWDIGTIDAWADLGFDIWALEFQSTVRRLVQGGQNSAAHGYRRGFFSGEKNFVITTPAGTAYGDVRLRLLVAGTNTALSIAVSGHDITANLATDGSGVATTTAAELRTALNADVAASAIITTTLGAGGSTALTALTSYEPVYFGDDGVNYTPTEVGEALAAYMDYTAPRYPLAKWLLNDSSPVLGPWRTEVGYGTQATPIAPVPLYEEMMAAMDAAGRSLWGFIGDWTYEYTNGTISSPNSGADDYLARTIDAADHWRTRGVRGFVSYESAFQSWSSVQPGGAYDYLNTDGTTEETLPAAYQERLVAYATEARAKADLLGMGAVLDEGFLVYNFGTDPSVLIDNLPTPSPSSVIPAHSLADTFFKTRAASQPRAQTRSRLGVRRRLA